jgi:hypothetical protein
MGKGNEMNGCTNLKRGLAIGALAASAWTGSGLVNAATQGAVGNSSTGTVDVSILVPNLVLVNNLDDVSLTYAPGGGDVVTSESFCIWATPGTLYTLSVSSASPTGTATFEALGGGGSSVNYTVDFDDQIAGATWESVVEGALLDNAGAGYAGANGATPGCVSDNARLRISAAESGNLDSADADVYVDTLTLLVEPF